MSRRANGTVSRGCVSTQKNANCFSARIALTFGAAVFLATFPQQNVTRGFGQYGTPMAALLPAGVVGGRTVTDVPALRHLARRAFQLSETLPDELLHTFEKQTAALPRATEVERFVVQRVGHDIFREGLLGFWEGRGAITDLAVPQLLRSSHIKPWAHCASDAERLDIWSGLLLAPYLDAAFDRGFITARNDRAVVVSSALDASARETLGLDEPLRVRALHNGHRAYLPWHRERVFKHGGRHG
jgi:putative restriction endonuclease